MADQVGQQFGQYRLSHFLGQGSFGEVYLGKHLSNHTLAAVKLLQTHLTAEDLKEFINEASAMFRLQHPHIVRLLDFGISPANTPFLVMAYAANGTLRKLHPKGTRLPMPRIIAYVSPIASALQHAHDQRLIHRDVKPENILLGSNNEVWLSDFGITSVAHSTRSLDTEKPGGTVPYMAPEQLRGKARPASDQYALGILVYEWLCGERPFSGTATEIAMQHLLEPPPSLREKVPTILLDVEQVVMRALAKDPAQRFHTILEFAEALEKAAQPSHLELLSTLTLQEGAYISSAEWIWGNHYLFIQYNRKKIEIIDVITGKTVFSEIIEDYHLGDGLWRWKKESCAASFPEGVISLTGNKYSPRLIDIRTGKEIAWWQALDNTPVDWLESWLNENHEGFDVFSQSPEGRKVIALANSLVVKSDADERQRVLLSDIFTFKNDSFVHNSIHGNRGISFCPPQWQLVAVAKANEQRGIHQIKVYRVVSH